MLHICPLLKPANVQLLLQTTDFQGVEKQDAPRSKFVENDERIPVNAMKRKG